MHTQQVGIELKTKLGVRFGKYRGLNLDNSGVVKSKK